jgi:hypothetical protein
MKYIQHKQAFEKITGLIRFYNCTICNTPFNDDDLVYSMEEEPVCSQCFYDFEGRLEDSTIDYWEALAENMEEAQATGN